MSTRSKLTDEAEQELLEGFSLINRELYQRLIKHLQRFDTQGGRLVLNADTINQINEAERVILTALNKSGYDSRVKNYLKDFDKIKEATITEQKKVNGITVGTRTLNNIQKSAIQQTTNILLGNGLDFNLTQPVKDILLESATSGMTIPQAEKQLRDLIISDSERLGKLERYVTQIARDSISQFDGMMQGRIAKDFELDCISYEGSIIKDSREQCRRWAAMGEIKISELTSEIEWAFNNGSGMVEGTTKDNFYIYRGGWSCRHTCTAVRCL